MYTIKKYSDSSIWNLTPDEEPVTADMFQIELASGSFISAVLESNGNTYVLDMVGSFTFGSDYQSVADIEGSISRISVYKNDNLINFESYSDGYGVENTKQYDFIQELTYLSGDDWFEGSSTYNNDDGAQGLSGNDTFIGYGDEENHDVFFGGDGIDVSKYRGQAAEYTWEAVADIWDSRVGDGSNVTGWEVSDSQADRDGTDQLNTVERLEFTDCALAFDVGYGENAGMAYRIYKAAFDRTPDAEGLGFWINALDQGYSLEQVATAVMTSPEFAQVYGANSSNRTFVDLLYQHVLHRTADDEGFNFWNNALNAGYSRGAVLAVYTECPETIALTEELIATGIQYQAWAA